MKEYIMEMKQVSSRSFMYEQKHELVRCKDCRNYYKGHCQWGTIYWERDPNWFCADGERKGDNET